jgi:DNA replication protein DnaC
MITNTSPMDYRKRVVIVSRLIRLCEVCGEPVADTPNGYRCISCKHVGYVEVFEHEAEEFRCGLWEQETIQALAYAAKMPNIGGAFVLYPDGEK